MTYHGRIRNGAVVLDESAADLPEGAAVEVSVVTPSIATSTKRPPITSIDQLQSKIPGNPFDGADPAELLRELRARPWRASTQDPLA